MVKIALKRAYLAVFVAYKQKSWFLRVKVGTILVQNAIKRCDCMLVWVCGML